jgi:hypothetical protein
MLKTFVYMGLGAGLVMGCTPTNAQTEPDQKQTEAAAPTATPPPKPCASEEYRQLDFWVGTWDLEWDAGNGKTGHGTNTITRSPYGDCVITENFDGSPSLQFKGMSVSMYHNRYQTWRQTWVDDQGGYFALSGGPKEGGTFELVNTRLGGQGPHLRMIWTDIKEGSLTWHWQGKKTDEDDWADQWVIHYTRRPE